MKWLLEYLCIYSSLVVYFIYYFHCIELMQLDNEINYMKLLND